MVDAGRGGEAECKAAEKKDESDNTGEAEKCTQGTTATTEFKRGGATSNTVIAPPEGAYRNPA